MRSRTGTGASGLRGFTLLEVLVAFSILAIALGVMFQAFGTGVTSVRLAEQYTVATLHAESRLAAIGVERALSEGPFEGDLPGSYRWRSQIIPAEVGEGSDGSGNPGDRIAKGLPPDQLLYEVVVTVDWTEGGTTRSVSLRTYRLDGGP